MGKLPYRFKPFCGNIRKLSSLRETEIGISAPRRSADPASELMKLCGMGDYPARKTMEAARRFSPEFCRKAAELVLETDYKMKTSFDDADRLLELLLLQLAQEARRGKN